MSLVKGALTDFKNKFLTSVHGRKLGIDHQGFTVGHIGQRLPYENSTAASTLANYGTSFLSGSTATFTLNAPPAIGAEKSILNCSSVTTATMTVIRSSSASGVTILGSTGVGGVRINLLNAGAGVTLVAQSSLVWALKATATLGTTPYVSISTSS